MRSKIKYSENYIQHWDQQKIHNTLTPIKFQQGRCKCLKLCKMPQELLYVAYEQLCMDTTVSTIRTFRIESLKPNQAAHVLVSIYILLIKAISDLKLSGYHYQVGFIITNRDSTEPKNIFPFFLPIHDRYKHPSKFIKISSVDQVLRRVTPNQEKC